MCGRYRLSRRKQIVEEYFDSVSGEDDWAPRYSIAPTKPVPVIRQNPKEPVRKVSLMDRVSGRQTTNGRSLKEADDRFLKRFLHRRSQRRQRPKP